MSLLIISPARAAIPNALVYQGSLKQAGVPVNGTYAMEFRLTNASGSQVHWTSGAQSVSVQDGLYRVELAPTVDWSAIDAHLELVVAGATLLPREKLASAPYALLARELTPGTTVQGNLSVQGTLGVSGKLALAGAALPAGHNLAVTGRAVVNSPSTAGSVLLHPNAETLLSVRKDVGGPTFLEVNNQDHVSTSNEVSGLMLKNKSQSIIGSVMLGKYANGHVGSDSAGLPLSNSFHLTPAGDEISRWVWTMGFGNQHEGIYFEGGNPAAVSARLTRDGHFMSKGLSVNNFSPSEPVHLHGRTRIQGSIAKGNGGGEEPYRGALRVVGEGDDSNGRLVVLQAPWGSTYQTDRYYMVGHNGSGTTNFLIRGDGAYLSSSSRALKEGIGPVARSLDAVSRMAGVRYKWKGDKADKYTMGFIAEDLAEIMPDAVEDGKYVNYDALVPVLVESIKELKARLEELEVRGRQ